MKVSRLSRTQKIFTLLAAALYLAAGLLHFVKPWQYMRIIPPFIPWHRALVYLSGAVEMTGAIGLLIPRTRRRAAWVLVALLVAVFPANIYMAMADVQVSTRPVPEFWLWARLPLQGLFIWWLLWCTREDRRRRLA